MTSAKANKSVGVWFIAQACQSGQHESDPRPQGASDGWKMRVSDPAHGPAHHPHLCPLPGPHPPVPGADTLPSETPGQLEGLVKAKQYIL